MSEFCIHPELATAIAERELVRIGDHIDDLRYRVVRLYSGRNQADISPLTVEAYARELEYLAGVLRSTKRAEVIHLEAAE